MPCPALYLPAVVLGEIRYNVDIVVSALSWEDVPVDPDSRTGGPLPLVYAELYRVGVILYRVRVGRYCVGVGAHLVSVWAHSMSVVSYPVSVCVYSVGVRVYSVGMFSYCVCMRWVDMGSRRNPHSISRNLEICIYYRKACSVCDSVIMYRLSVCFVW